MREEGAGMAGVAAANYRLLAERAGAAQGSEYDKTIWSQHRRSVPDLIEKVAPYVTMVKGVRIPYARLNLPCWLQDAMPRHGGCFTRPAPSGIQRCLVG